MIVYMFYVFAAYHQTFALVLAGCYECFNAVCVCKLQMKELFYKNCLSAICNEGGPRLWRVNQLCVCDVKYSTATVDEHWHL